MQLQIGNRVIGDGCQPFYVAEIGQNHNGDVYHAIRLVGAAERAGVDAVKFQLRDAEREFLPEVLAAPHPDPQHAYGETYGEHRKALDLTVSDLHHIQYRIKYNNWRAQMYATPCHQSCIEPLFNMDMPAYKIASKDIRNIELIEGVARIGKPVILSTGMCDVGDLGRAIDAVRKFHNQLIVMQCVSMYPCPLEYAALAAIETIRNEYDCLVGYSDHSGFMEAGSWAVQRGACMVEAHITSVHGQRGTDHACSIPVADLRHAVYLTRMSHLASQGRSWISPTDATQEVREKIGA
jgi:sialic acid synthase SpsE